MLAMMYLFAWWVITQAMSDVVSSALLVNREAPPVNREIQELNRKTRNVSLSSQEFYQLTPLIVELAQKLPGDIRLAGVDIDRVKNTVNISGVAATRDALLSFQKVITEIKWIKGATAPTSQLFQKENINFEIRGTLQGLPPLKK
jgi:Tfp pilus assembly protein PilN